MGYGYGVGFVKATNDIPIKTLRCEGNNTGSAAFFPYKILGTASNYSVPSDKKGLIALLRTVDIGSINHAFSGIGYADDALGTNFVTIARADELDIATIGSERYWVLEIPQNKFILFKHYYSGSGQGRYTGIIVLFEV
jgi:hypothetical protein